MQALPRRGAERTRQRRQRGAAAARRRALPDRTAAGPANSQRLGRGHLALGDLVGVVHVQMRDPALHEGRSVAGRAAGHLDAVLAEVGRESGCDRSVYPREKNVGLRRLGDPERAGMGGCCLGDACRQAPGAVTRSAAAVSWAELMAWSQRAAPAIRAVRSCGAEVLGESQIPKKRAENAGSSTVARSWPLR